MKRLVIYSDITRDPTAAYDNDENAAKDLFDDRIVLWLKKLTPTLGVLVSIHGRGRYLCEQFECLFALLGSLGNISSVAYSHVIQVLLTLEPGPLSFLTSKTCRPKLLHVKSQAKASVTRDNDARAHNRQGLTIRLCGDNGRLWRRHTGIAKISH